LLREGFEITRCTVSRLMKTRGHSRPEVTARYAYLKDEATRAALDHVGAVYTRRREIASSTET